MKRIRPLVITSLLSAIFAKAIAAELPVETFFRNFQYQQAKISPDGDFLGVLAADKKRVGLAVLNLKKPKVRWAYAVPSADVQWFDWANNERFLLCVGDQGYRWAGLIQVPRDRFYPLQLIPIGDRWTHFVGYVRDSPDEILVSTSFQLFRQALEASKWGRSAVSKDHYPDVFRMNIITGKIKQVVKNPGGIIHWMVDHTGTVRIGLGIEDGELRVFGRTKNKTEWEVLTRYRLSDPDLLIPIGFDYDDRTLFMVGTRDEDTLAIYRFDIEEKAMKGLAFRHANADVEALFYSDKRRAVAGVLYETERPQVYWFDSEYQSLQAGIDKALPNTLNLPVSHDKRENKIVFFAFSDRVPGAYYLFDSTSRKLEKLFDKADWIQSDEMAEMKPIEYRARDGFHIRGYLTVPKGSSGKNLPLVVNPHGGPFTHTSWGFNPETQFFANRGYAVLQMNFRGSTGRGRAFLAAGFRQFGLKIQDDVTDGVRWAIAEGIADAKRICIYGASFGGYAVLMGLEQTPELYRCGICMAGMTDLVRLFEETAPQESAIRAIRERIIGDPEKDRKQLEATSPLTHADRIESPVLLAYGELDERVPIEQGRRLAEALKRNGKLYEIIVKKDEGHGFRKEENRIEFWKKVDEFLKATMN